MRFDGGPRWVHWTAPIVVFLFRHIKWAAGCFLFARRDVFEKVGGFDERYPFAHMEDADLQFRLQERSRQNAGTIYAAQTEFALQLSCFWKRLAELQERASARIVSEQKFLGWNAPNNRRSHQNRSRCPRWE